MLTILILRTNVIQGRPEQKIRILGFGFSGRGRSKKIDKVMWWGAVAMKDMTSLLFSFAVCTFGT